jgi:hypothetical protein
MRCLVAGLFILNGAGGALAQDPPEAARSVEIGVRYWLSTGKTSSSHDASSQDCFGVPCGNPTSTLTYDNLDAHTVELYARKGFDQGWFLKGNAGIGVIPNGTLVDQDFVVTQFLVFETTSGLSGKMYYGTIDVGREIWKRGNSTLGLFVGYHHWNERLDVRGFSNTQNGFFVFLDEPGENVPTIRNEQTWNSTRVGLELNDVRGRTRFRGELVLVPYAKYRNEDSHFLRDDLGPTPNVIASGRGRGYQVEVEVRRSFPQLLDLEFGLAYRLWRLSSKKGNMTFAGEDSFPVSELESERQGVMFTISKSW